MELKLIHISAASRPYDHEQIFEDWEGIRIVSIFFETVLSCSKACCYLHRRVHEAGVAQVGESTEARALALPALVGVVITVAVGVVGR